MSEVTDKLIALLTERARLCSQELKDTEELLRFVNESIKEHDN